VAGEPVEAGLVVVEIVLPGVKAEVAAGGNVFGKVVEVEGLGGVELVLRDCFLVEGGIGFDGSDLVREMVMVEEFEAWKGLEKGEGVELVGVGEEDEAMALLLELWDDIPHRFVGREDVLPGAGEIFGAELGSKDVEGLSDEVLIAESSGFVGILEGGEFGREGGVRRSENSAMETVEMEFEKDVADVEEKGHFVLGDEDGIFERMKSAAWRAASGLARVSSRFF